MGLVPVILSPGLSPVRSSKLPGIFDVTNNAMKSQKAPRAGSALTGRGPRLALPAGLCTGATFPQPQ